jgi:DNA-binding MarR family transcriptional regulator
VSDLVVLDNHSWAPIFSLYDYYLKIRPISDALQHDFVVIERSGCRSLSSFALYDLHDGPMGSTHLSSGNTGKASPPAAVRPRARVGREPLTEGVEARPLGEVLGFALRRAQQAVLADFNEKLADLGLRPGQFGVLALIREQPGSSQTDISTALGIEKANFVAIIADLERRGLVLRSRSPNDARTYQLGLTRAGDRLLDQAVERHRTHEAKLTRTLGVDDRRQLLDILARLSEHV